MTTDATHPAHATVAAPETPDFNPEILEMLRADAGADHLATRAAERIASKGFLLLGASCQPGFREGFRWGRSSHGETTKVLWNIDFGTPAGDETLSILVVCQTTTYTRANPYDRVPKGSGIPSCSIQATDEAKAALAWAKP